MRHQEVASTIADRIFPQRTRSSVCGQDWCNPVCRILGKCSILEKSDEQLAYVTSPISEDCFLDACPGSGKTEVVGLKAAYEFNAWTEKFSGAAILTFTNNAADVIRNRVQRYAGFGKARHPHFIGTVDSWLHGYVAHPFIHMITGYKGRKGQHDDDKSVRLVEDSEIGGWLSTYRCKTSYYSQEMKESSRAIPIYANMLRFDYEQERWEIRIPSSNRYVSDKEYFDSPGFTSFRLDKPWLTLPYLKEGFEETKVKFWADGFATYHDIECLSYDLLQNKPELAEKLSQRFPLIIIDECQDLSWIQLKILGILGDAGTTLHLVGDLNQSIYEFKRVDPQNVVDFVKSKGISSRDLSQNFRSCQPIVDLCSKLINGKAVIGKGDSSKRPASVCFNYDKERLSELPTRFERYVEQFGVDINKSVILARGWTTVMGLQSIDKYQSNSSQHQLALAIYLWSRNDSRHWDESLKSAGEFVSRKYFKDDQYNSRRQYCPSSVSSAIRWRLFLSHLLDECSRSESGLSNLDQTWDSWAKCVRMHFGKVVRSQLSILHPGLVGTLSPALDLDGKTFRVPSNTKSTKVIDTLVISAGVNTSIEVTTIHSVKGKTFDATLLVSSPDARGGQGGHWTEWIEDVKDEHARFAYVASSRPRALLAWAIPLSERSDEQLHKLQDLGFTMI